MSGMPRSTMPFDARPLVEPVDHRAVRAYTQRLRRSGVGRISAGAIVAIVVGGIVVFNFVSIGASMFARFAAAAAQGGGFGVIAVVVPGTAFVLVLAGLGVGVFFFVRRLAGGQNERRYRLNQFAQVNHMSYVPRFDAPGLPGMIFRQGSTRHALDLVRGQQPRFVEFANYRYTTGSGKNSTVHKWGYVAVKLDVPLPHIVLDAVGNNGLFGSNLPTSFDRDQRLSLEGDFDRYFSLYCPTGYERDALYLFTPDIMARVIDHAAAVDIEIVDDWLFLYAKRDFTTLDPAMWAWLFSLVAALLDKLAQWERWRDDRLPTPAMQQAPLGAAGLPVPATPVMLRPPPGVAASGRRLKRGIPWAVIIIVAVGGLVFVLPQLIGIIAAVSR
ncbi:hypothetical protein GCM10009796_19700 [Microbacterium koreense]